MRRSTRKAILTVAGLLLNATVMFGIGLGGGWYHGKRAGFREGVLTTAEFILELTNKDVEGPKVSRRKSI